MHYKPSSDSVIREEIKFKNTKETDGLALLADPDNKYHILMMAAVVSSPRIIVACTILD